MSETSATAGLEGRGGRMKKVLIIDDDLVACELLAEVFSRQNWEAKTAQTPLVAEKMVQTESFDLIVSDINLGDKTNGLDLLRKFREKMPVILVTAFGSLESVLEARREGAWELLSKPFNYEDLINLAERAVKSRQENQATASTTTVVDSKIVGRSPAMINLFNEIARVSPSQSTVLIIGESGTGKELIARAIHENSPRANAAFVPVNCGAITESLLEAELFGHIKGSFTGANIDRAGLFEQADKGTLFLDEIGETSPAMQVKLLRALQESEIRRIGGSKPIKVDVRVIAATNRDLEAEVKAGRFREDLFYRLSVVTLRVPRLKDRRTDIPLLATKFLAKSAAKIGHTLSWSEDALTTLSAYNWPGNVRELENAIEYTALHARGEVIDIEDLPERIRAAVPTAQVKKKHAEVNSLFQDMPTLDELEKRYMMYVLENVGYHRTRAAEVMGVDRRTLYRMAERLGITLEEKE